uniref:TACI cysteine-rich domain-containing protein n=1 Tax=Echeneis naucrates TaxID=173247 RepID=A0A665XAD6_ECHNA
MGESCPEGHFWDPLVKLCVTCQLACQQQQVIRRCISYCAPIALEDSTVLLYFLLVLCIVLLFSSLSLTLAVFLRGSRARTSIQEAKKANHNNEHGIQLGKEIGLPGGQLRQSPKDCETNLRSDDSSPTETCVCVHCFPDLKQQSQGNDRLLRAPVLTRTQIHKGGPLWTEESPHFSGRDAQEGAVR